MKAWRLCSPGERIRGGEIRKAAEIAIRGPELADAVRETQRCDARVVHPWTGDAAGLDQGAELLPVLCALREEQ